MERTEMRMIRWLCGVSVKESQPSTELRRRLCVEAIVDVTRRRRLGWHGHAERKDDADYVKACTRLVVEGKVPAGRPRKTWQNILSADRRLLKVDLLGRPRTKEMECNRTV